MLKLTNNTIKCEIETVGAEICSLKNEQTGKEYIWQGMPGKWNRHAPILFPCVGRMNGDAYIHNDKTYYMQKHGFARNMPFKILCADKTTAYFRLTNEESTEQVFPFKFEIDVIYELVENTLKCNYIVRNLSNETMYFSLGFHPGFNIKIGDKLKFSHKETMTVPYLNGSDVEEDKNNHLIFDNRDELVLTNDLFEKGSLSFPKIKSKSISIVDQTGHTYLTESYNKASTLWLWANPGAEFVCIEPWSGSDERFPEQILSKKKGILKLDCGKSHTLSVDITID